MITSEYINLIKLSDEDKETLAHTYKGLGLLQSLLSDRVSFEGTPLSHAIGNIDVLKGTILTLISDGSKE